MFDETDTPAPASSAFDNLMALLKLLGNDKLFQKKLDELMAATVKANETRASAERAQADHAAKAAARTAELAKREREISELFAEAQSRKELADKRYDDFDDYANDVRRLENNTRARMAALAGMSWNPKIQAGPSQEELDKKVFGGLLDAPYHDDSIEHEAVPIPGGGTMTRTTRTRPPRPVRADQ